MTIPAVLREYAESPDRFAQIPAGASVERFADERICILQGPTWASVSGISVTAGEVQALLAEVRERVPAEKDPLWWIGPSARPLGLYEQLRALGLGEPRDRASQLKALVLTREPELASEGIEVCRIATYEQFRAAREVQWEAFETPATGGNGTACGSARTSRSRNASDFPSASLRCSTAGQRRRR